MLDINITLLIQLVNFIVTLVVLDYLLIKPIRGIIRKRRDLANSLLADAETFTSEAAQKLEGYEAALVKAKEEAAQLREERKSEALVAEASLTETARRDAQEFLAASRKEVNNAIAQVMADMEKRIPDLSSMAVAKLLGARGRESEFQSSSHLER